MWKKGMRKGEDIGTVIYGIGPIRYNGRNWRCDMKIACDMKIRCDMKISCDMKLKTLLMTLESEEYDEIRVAYIKTREKINIRFKL